MNIDAASQKRQIAKTIRPDHSLTVLPPLETRPRRVLLVVPPGTREESYGRLSGAAGQLPMLGLAYIASSLIDQGHQVKVIDYEVSALPMSQVENDIRDFRPDIVGMTAYITNMRRCGQIAKIVKSVDSNITVIFGGPQVTIFPEEAFLCPSLDIIVLSEGEIIVRNLMNALGDDEKMRQVRGIWFRSPDGRIFRGEREGLASDIDLFKPPAIELYKMDAYFPPAHIRGKRVAHLLASRGCPFQCTFCETKLTFGRSFRYHSTDRVIAELEALIALGYDGFQFYDDVFTANKKRVEDMCHAIIARKWRISWMCFTRTNTVSPDLLALMRKAGCYQIVFGGETGNDDLLNLLKKGVTVEQNAIGFRMARDAGIETVSSFMLGLPGETPEHSERTIKFALDSGLDYAVFPITEPYPGTELWVDAHKYGSFDNTGNYTNSLLSEHSAVWIPHGRSREELEKLALRAMQLFYFRPRQILKALGNLFVLPPRRAARYILAGIHFFLIARFKRSVAGTRY